MVRMKHLVKLRVECGSNGERPYVALEHIVSSTGALIEGTDLPVRSPSRAGMASVEPGDVLFGKLRPYLAKTWLVDRPALASTELMCLRPRAGIDSRWLGYLAMSTPFVEWAVATSEGTKMPRTSWEKVGEYRPWLPSGSEQRAIADYLDTETSRIDTLITNKRRMIELLEERRAGTVEAHIRELSAWHGESPLKFHTPRILVGIVVTPAAYYADSGVPALRGINIKPGYLDLDDLVYLSEDAHILHSKSRLFHGDIVVVRTGQAGAACVVPRDLEGSNCVDLLIVRNSSELDPRYLEYVINSDWTIKHIEKHSVGTIQSHFNVESLKQLPIPVPPLDVQQTTAAALDHTTGQIDSLLQDLRSQIKLLAERRQALITAAVTGELAVSGDVA